VLVDLDTASRKSVKPGDVRRSAATVFSGLQVGALFEQQKIYGVVVWGVPEARQSITDISDILVEKSNMHHVRLGDVADVAIVPAPTVIKHDHISPYVDVVANVVGRDLGSVNREVEDRLQNIEFPLEYHPEVLGEYVERLDVQQGLIGVTLAALIGIYLLLQAHFRSWLLAFIAFLALPASVGGGMLGVLLSSGVISLGSIVGFLAVLGIAARNSVVLVDYYQQLEREQGMQFGTELILHGARECLLPILASSAAVIAAFLPVIVFGQVPGLEIMQSMAIVILSGLLASTLFTLLVVPTLYLVIGEKADRLHDIGLANA
jgi:multidrug efflux pump subunit AcrB